MEEHQPGQRYHRQAPEKAAPQQYLGSVLVATQPDLGADNADQVRKGDTNYEPRKPQPEP